MSWIEALRERLRPVFDRERLQAEMDEELAFHLEREVERNVASGMSPRQARRAARARMGGAIRPRESVRRLWRGIELGGLGQESRLAARRLARRPAFTLVAVLTFGLGIGATTAIFSLVRGVLIRPLPYPDADRLVMIWNASRSRETWFSERELLEYERATSSFERLGAYTTLDVNLTEDAEPERITAGALTAGALSILGAHAVVGRAFTTEEDQPGRNDVALLSHELWQRRYGGDPDVVGRALTANGNRLRVLGVLPPDFRLPADYRAERPAELFVPLAIDRTADLPWGSRSFHIVGRLLPGVTPEAASADVRAAGRAWERAGYVDNIDGRLDRDAVPFDEFLLADMRTPLFLLMGAVAFMLLIACANVAHLLLARAESRRAEVAVSAALGAGRARLVRQFLVESGLLAAAGTALGLAIAAIGMRAVVAVTPIQAIRLRGVELDAGVLAFAGLLTIATTLLAGLAPALQLSRVDLVAAMGGTRGADRAGGRRRVRRLLVMGETALSLVLVIGAVLLGRSLASLRSIDLGFRPARVLAFDLALPASSYPESERVDDFYRTLLGRISELPGVERAGAARLVPLRGSIGTWSVTLEDRAPEPGEEFEPAWQIVTPGYPETMGIERVAGRSIESSDRADAPLVAVVSRTMADRFWPGEDPLGKRFHLGTLDQPWIEVVGVVRSPRHNAVVEDPRVEMYIPHAQWPVVTGGGVQRGMSVVVRTEGDPLAVLPAVRRIVREMDASLPIAEARRLDDVAAEALAEPRFTSLMLGLFAALALALAAIGLYGVTSYAASRRTNEMGIRLALGAGRSNVTRLVLRDALGTVMAGVALGGLGALWLTRFLAGQLYGVSRLDPFTFVAVPALLLCVAAVAAYLPARRAARVSPVNALRAE